MGICERRERQFEDTTHNCPSIPLSHLHFQQKLSPTPLLSHILLIVVSSNATFKCSTWRHSVLTVHPKAKAIPSHTNSQEILRTSKYFFNYRIDLPNIV
jgi:hypothetical protein